ncbi:MAG: hypothetical protein BWY96_02894 [Spirochaetes bacterium ADurb.BinA120]|nr:MAG: hypothetical protein BWY96_02894 [Spirochaetes bacterium ADurb.BinA120]
MIQLAGAVMESTNTTASPSPTEVDIFLERARNEHMPRKYASMMFSVNIARMPMFTSSIALYSSRYPEIVRCSQTMSARMMKAPGASTISPLFS